MAEERSDLRSGITAAFAKTLNEALQIGMRVRFFLSNIVRPALVVGVLKGSQGTPGLVAAISAEKAGPTNCLTTIIKAGNWDPIGVEGTQAGAGNTVIGTVEAGKHWLIHSVGLTSYATATNILAKIVAPGNYALIQDKSEITAARTVYSNSQVVTYSKPLRLVPGESVTIVSGAATMTALGWIIIEKEDV